MRCVALFLGLTEFHWFFLLAGGTVLGLFTFQFYREIWKLRRNDRRLLKSLKRNWNIVQELADQLLERHNSPSVEEVEKDIEREVNVVKSVPRAEDPITSQIAKKLREGTLKGTLQVTREEPIDVGGGWHINPATFAIELEEKKPEKKSDLEDLMPD